MIREKSVTHFSIFFFFLHFFYFLSSVVGSSSSTSACCKRRDRRRVESSGTRYHTQPVSATDVELAMQKKSKDSNGEDSKNDG